MAVALKCDAALRVSLPVAGRIAPTRVEGFQRGMDGGVMTRGPWREGAGTLVQSKARGTMLMHHHLIPHKLIISTSTRNEFISSNLSHELKMHYLI